jgi:hypothetical protein
MGWLSRTPSERQGGIVETRILIVAHKTIATPALVEAIRQRTEKGPCTLALLIPDSCDHAETAWTLRYARRMLSKAVGAPVEGIVAEGEDAYAGVAQVVRDGEYDEIIISLLAGPDSRWVSEDLHGRAESLGVPITIVQAEPAHASPAS